MDFYKKAALTLDDLAAKKTSIKAANAYLPEKERKRVLALVLETLKYQDVLRRVLSITQLLKHERKVFRSPPTTSSSKAPPTSAAAARQPTPESIALVLVHDLLLSKSQAIAAGAGPLKDAVLRHKARLKAELARERIRAGSKEKEALGREGKIGADKIPRYVRVNTNIIAYDRALEILQSASGGSYVLVPPTTPLSSFTPKSFRPAPPIPNLLAFHPSASGHLIASELYKNGSLILQDLASCMPPVVLLQGRATEKVGKVVDATAAPGNKTSFLSALLDNQRTVIAFERSHRRFETLRAMLSKARCTNVRARNGDFLEVTKEEMEGVTHLLLDPSCSGSGIVNRLDFLVEQETDDPETLSTRLASLAAFQLQMIKHAMSFPSVHRIVYSTCSIHAEENERVVLAALSSREAQQGGFALAPRAEVLPAWERRGWEKEFEGSVAAGMEERVVRCEPEEDGTNGFFVACFVRTSAASAGGVKRKAEDLDADADEDVGGEGEEGAAAAWAAGGGGGRKKKKVKKKKKKKGKGTAVGDAAAAGEGE